MEPSYYHMMNQSNPIMISGDNLNPVSQLGNHNIFSSYDKSTPNDQGFKLTAKPPNNSSIDYAFQPSSRIGESIQPNAFQKTSHGGQPQTYISLVPGNSYSNDSFMGNHDYYYHPGGLGSGNLLVSSNGFYNPFGNSGYENCF